MPIYRDSKTGRIVTKAYAEANPDTTQKHATKKERIERKKNKNKK